jgi:transposase
MSLPISSSTGLRLVHSLKLPDCGQIIHLGVDDWALRKGCKYGTAVVNMDTGRIIDLLPDRDGASLADWLSGQNEIKTVNRDRASSFSSVLTKSNLKIEQIADRFHLVKNLSQHVEAIMHSNSRLINKVVSEEKNYHKESKPHRNCRLFDIAKSELADGYTQTAVAKKLGLSRYTVWKYAHSERFSIGLRRTNVFDKYKSLIENEFSKGTSLSKIHKLIVQAGYKGARSNFYSHFGDKNRANPFERTISMRSLSRHMFAKNISTISNRTERCQVELLSRRISWIEPLNELCSSFSELLKNGDKGSLNSWLARAESLNLKRLNRFVSGVRKDYQAVLNAVLHSSSSGVVEGCINRLKSIKRQMYGRASLELLKRKIILSTSG